MTLTACITRVIVVHWPLSKLVTMTVYLQVDAWCDFFDCCCYTNALKLLQLLLRAWSLKCALFLGVTIHWTGPLDWTTGLTFDLISSV